MNAETKALWNRAIQAYETASLLIQNDPDSAASRAYYSAFYAVAAVFTLRDKSFSKHSAMEAAVHRDLVNSGDWEESLGEDYTYLRESRERGDYGGVTHVTVEEAVFAVEAAKRILEKVRKSDPALFIQPPFLPKGNE